MNNLQSLKNELQEVINKQVRLETLIEQANKCCREIEQKYNIKNEQELKALLDNAEIAYNQSIQEAQQYINTVKQELSLIEGILS